MRLLSIRPGLLALVGGLLTPPVFAIPQNITYFCQYYDTAPACEQQRFSCTGCHTIPPQLNVYGGDLRAALQEFPDYEISDDFFAAYLSQGLQAIADQDSDADGSSNADEISQGTAPYDANDQPDPPIEPIPVYDPLLAYKRIELLFCGQLPEANQLRSLAKQLSQDPKQVTSTLHARLDTCLQSDYWLNQALPKMADPKIRPNRSIGAEGNPFVIGDYRYDYRLFVHILSGDRDIRDLLLADYHIDEQGQRVYATIPDQKVKDRIVVGNGQPLVASKRAGLATTQWFISTNTMFALLPRNTASQVYRAYLGLDIAKSEGLFPVANEPRDVDQKGVSAPACAVCHSTLDPLSYSFANLNGLDQSANDPLYPGVGTYNPRRSPWENQGYLFGEPVNDLTQWMQVAANSQPFKTNLIAMIYTNLMGKLPDSPHLQREFDELSQYWPQVNYQFNGMLHRFIDTLAFGGQI